MLTLGEYCGQGEVLVGTDQEDGGGARVLLVIRIRLRGWLRIHGAPAGTLLTLSYLIIYIIELHETFIS